MYSFRPYKDINQTFKTHVVRQKNFHPETQSTHSMALSVEEKVKQLRRRLKFHQNDKSFTRKVEVSEKVYIF